MFLEWIRKLGFLEPDPDSSIYLHFPVKARMLLASYTATFLLQTDTDKNYLATPTQIHVAMEALGPGFGLPIEGHYETIEGVIDVYRRWLLGPTTRPDALAKEEQRFYRKIFKHFSLLFEARGQVVELQTGLCLRVLQVMDQASREIGHTFDAETWDVLLKIILGATDRLLSDANDSSQHLSTKLCPQLLKVLFGIWMRSKTTDEYLWSHLAKLSRRWRHRLPLMYQWSNMCAGFTAKVIHQLYGGEEGSPTLQINEYEGEVFELDEELTYFFWHKFLYLLGNVNGISVPNNHLEALRGVHQVVEQFLNIGTKGATLQPPEGNTIFELTEMFLFDCISAHITEDDKGAFDKGKAQAFITATKVIISKNSTTKFERRHLAAYYYTAQKIIRHNNYLMSVVISNSVDLFKKELEGSRVLMPYYLEAIRCIMVATKFDRISVPFSSLRESALRVLCSLLSFPSHFTDLAIANNDDFPTIKFNEIHSTFNEVLMDGLQTEDNSQNRQLLLWIIQSYLLENLPNVQVVQTFSESIVTFVLTKITENIWTTDDVMASLSLLSQLSRLLQYQPQKNAVKSVTILTGFIETALQNGKVAENIIVRALHTLLDWVMSGPWILNQQTLIHHVLSVLALGIGHNPRTPPMQSPKTSSPSISHSKSTLRHIVTMPIQNVALVAYEKIMNHIDNFPVTDLGPSRISSLYNESDILKMYSLKKSDVKHFIVDGHTLLSIIKHDRREGTRQKVTLILRSMAGKFVWNSEMEYEKDSYREPASSNLPFSPFKPYKWPPVEDDEPLIQSAKEALSDSQYELYERVLKGTRRIVQQYREVAESLREPDLKLKRPTPPLSLGDGTDSTTVRLLVHHLGYRGSNYKEDFYAVNPDGLEEDLRYLDQMPERETYQIGVLFVNREQTELPHILDNRGSSEGFRHLVQHLGWLVKLDEHRGFKGNLTKEAGTQAPYYANFDTEVIFGVGMFFQESSPQETRLSFLRQSKVLITWVEDLEQYRPDPALDASVHILLSPLNSKLVFVRIHTEEQNLPLIGPLVDNMAVTPLRLPVLLRETAINAARLLGSKVEPLMLRKDALSQFIHKHRVTENATDFYSSLMAHQEN
ncbi:rap/ran GTPase-activating protein [Planoprotostelium fungivorum]|uniref:Rap/ran GTPase-activating protein n=1 Tax=Planoprotostelium fungivorum TaxID=1890364 RepID=A0A2P6N901_9EUKA|nr:rap/ran GTPase-activating protein [Planoprotostelium fungivorum]